MCLRARFLHALLWPCPFLLSAHLGGTRQALLLWVQGLLSAAGEMSGGNEGEGAASWEKLEVDAAG